ncbi:MAG: hypothetical protein MNPFHGCM_01874 [Gemmatimonadaceae bacterium]|nr:hypothetical protein [Gemmatimonadaceae bacterium]
MLVALALGCAPQGPVLVEATPAPNTGPPPGTIAGTPAAPGKDMGTRTSARDMTWRVYAREHVDLWLHGFAMLQADSTLVPYFRPGYRTHIEAVRRERRVTTTLDASRERLSSYIDANPRLISAQFLPLYFQTWEEMREGFDLFLSADGNPRRARDQASAQVVATFAASFPQRRDREWARSFVHALDDERTRFYGEYWLAETRAREGARTTFELAWRTRFRGRLERFLTNVQEDDGEVLLSLTLGGEGRTVSVNRRENYVAVPFPDDDAAANEPVFVFLHEIAGAPSAVAVRDQTTPAEQRDGTADRYASLAAVRGGAIILAHVAPDLVPEYQRYYLRIARARVPDGDPTSAFERSFSLPDAVRDAVARQIDIILGGI